ncbi:MAG: hypothetical protein J2P50_07260 [Hyphomicrobiaceae bacterium]|nr:hypothetical protein [Hyphomicrobiaceae bacterium]
MRTTLAVAISVSVSGLFALSANADAAGRYKRDARPPYGYAYQHPSERAVCEERAKHEDPTGAFGGFPCWAREAFGRGTQGGGRGRR